MAKKRNVFRVVPNSKGGWKLTLSGKTISNHRKKETAKQKGRKLAKRDKPSQLVLHKKDGTIQTEYTYGRDPYPPEG